MKRRNRIGFFKNKYSIFKLFAVLVVATVASICAPVDSKAAPPSLYLAPGAGTYAINTNFSVAIKANTDGKPINAADGSLSFDNSFLEVVSISKSSSIFSLWTTEPTFSNSAGTVSFSGGLPPPAYKGTAGNICTITFKAKKVGTASVRFKGGALLAADGKGTNILVGLGSGTYTISPKIDTPKQDIPQREKPKAEQEYNKPKISSATHPDSNTWYNKSQLIVKWQLPKNVKGVSISLSKDSISDPGPVSDGLFGEKEFNIEESGVYYVNVKFKDAVRWGTTAHFRVMIDLNPPLPFEVEVKYMGVGEWPELNFEAKDEESGLEFYDIFIGSLEEQAHKLEADKKSFIVSDVNAGEHTAIIKAVDKAGNERAVTVNFTIDAIPTPEILNYPKEVRPGDNFYLNGTAIANAEITIYTKKGSTLFATSSVQSDANGNWFYINDSKLADGRYLVWVEARNDKGIKSAPSSEISFMVSQPVFATVGNTVVNYFTVFVSLLFMILLIILIIILIIWLIRKRLKKETIEIEDVLKKNMELMKKEIDNEFLSLSKFEGKIAYKKEKAKTKASLKNKIDLVNKKILKEVKDVEDILK